ncbi:M14 family metallopeptidase [Pseudoduganella ginsengisoli]|uniref:Deacylase n=1 Tax=Pseudoduganella ginsengisoli TaxID=1462440 RepID=A0A6L6Q6Y5_9BURK|nr:succinylglutamate desuccinylase/aspartoacylase family protein [Pseudoduganella ginsengisoli]MTW05214.1 deacylase [Pseudoduganella ginsengisoli]
MRTEHHVISTSHGGAVQLASLHFGTPGAGKKAYLQAALHADEVPGMLVAQCLRQRLLSLEAAGKIRGEVVLVPAANPIGLAQAIQGTPLGRFDLSTGINFNRAHPHVGEALKSTLQGRLGGDPDANVREIRRQALAHIRSLQPASDAAALKQVLLSLAIDADIVLDLHCDNEAVMHVYTGTPLAGAIAPLARLLRAQAVLLATEAGGEPFDEACSRLWWELAAHFPDVPIPPACIAATVELRGEMDVGYDLARRDAGALLAYLATQGVLDADDMPLPQPLCPLTPLEGVEPLLAPHAGVLVYTRTLGERLEPGMAVADVIDPVTGATTAVRCTVGGVFFGRSAHRHVLRGMNIGKVAGHIPFRSGNLLSL